MNTTTTTTLPSGARDRLRRAGLVAAAFMALALALAAAGGVARAEGQPSPQVTKQAKAHFLAGKALQEAGEYDQAIAEYLTAYKLTPLPDLVFNLAQCARLKGDRRAALAEYQRYLTVAPDGRGAADARAYVAALRKEIADADARAKAAVAPKPPAPQTATTPRPPAAPAPVAIAPAPRPAAPPPAPVTTNPVVTEPAVVSPPSSSSSSSPRERGRTLRIAGIATGAAGAALIATGVVFGVKARSASQDLGSLGDGATWNQDLYDSGKADQRNMYILLGVGTAAAIGGGVMYVLGRRADAETVAVGPAPLSDGGGLAVAGRF